MCPRCTFRFLLDWAAQLRSELLAPGWKLAGRISLPVCLVATSSPLHTNFLTAHFFLLRPETSMKSSAAGPWPCSVANTVEKFPSVRSNLPAPASADPVRTRGLRTREHFAAPLAVRFLK